MKRFAALYQRLDRSTSTLDKRAALVAYFAQAPAPDVAWAVWLLSGRKLGGPRMKIASRSELRAWIAAVSGTPDWLVDDCHQHVGDLAETITLLLSDAPEAAATEQTGPRLRGAEADQSLSAWIEQRLLAVAGASEAQRRAVVEQAWRTLPTAERLVFNKLLTGALRVGVSQGLVQQALAQGSGVDIARIAQRMLGDWQPSAAFVQRLLDPEARSDDASAPYPFFLASPLEQEPQALGPVGDWLLEWKWDGIRLQLIRRGGVVALWSRGEERLDGRFPEVEAAARQLPADAVIDGELLAWGEGEAPLPFGVLQRRIQRRKPGARLLAEAPVRVVAYDVLELQGQDLRMQPLAERRARLADLLQPLEGRVIRLSPQIEADDWADAQRQRDESRARGVEGLMVKRRSSGYQHGRRRGDWWKWKIDPLTVDAVLIYAQAGHGRRSTLHTDYTFALWSDQALVPVAKAYSGLTDAEILELDRWIRAHTMERFGPVRSVQAQHVFELGFEAINRSARHKSGVALRFPRILRWRRDKSPADADQVQALLDLAV